MVSPQKYKLIIYSYKISVKNQTFPHRQHQILKEDYKMYSNTSDFWSCQLQLCKEKSKFLFGEYQQRQNLRGFLVKTNQTSRLTHLQPYSRSINVQSYKINLKIYNTDRYLSASTCIQSFPIHIRLNPRAFSPEVAEVGHIKKSIVSNGWFIKSNLQLLFSLQVYQSMEKEQLTAKSFLKTKEMREKYECGICYQICMKPVQCRGTCARIFCMKCVSDTRQVLDRCPNRCSSPFLVAPLPDLSLDFFCPYNPSLCDATLNSLRSFGEHYLTCPYVSPQQTQKKRLEREYRCLKDHQLEFFIGSYQEMIASVCGQCEEQKLCRSYCRVCEQFYCVSCRVPPCSKEGCPIGHSFNFQRIANLNYICDICGISTAVSNDGVYDDNCCNFGICQACFSELPEKFDQSKPRSLIANINTQCSCGHTLIYKNEVHSRSECQLCRKNKECPKVCGNCGKKYCLKCKLMDVCSDSTCGLQHPIARFALTGYEQFMRKENAFGCMRCGQVKNEYFYDQQCCTRICEQCFEYCMRVTTDKERPVLLKCEKNHVLMYICGAEDYLDTCAKCQQQKIVKLACNYCEQDKRTYCFQCKPIQLKTCYYQHALKQGEYDGERQCHFCMQSGTSFFYCHKCIFYVCHSCHQEHTESISIQNEDVSSGEEM